MTFAPEEFLNLADQLARTANQESEYRTALYLAYYGLFLLVRDALGITHKGGSVHRHVEDSLRQVAPVQSDALRSLRMLRNNSSYDLTVVISQQDAQDAIALARVVESELKALGVLH